MSIPNLPAGYSLLEQFELGLTEATAAVSAAADQSGNGNNGSQATAGLRPARQVVADRGLVFPYSLGATTSAQLSFPVAVNSQNCSLFFVVEPFDCVPMQTAPNTGALRVLADATGGGTADCPAIYYNTNAGGTPSCSTAATWAVSSPTSGLATDRPTQRPLTSVQVVGLVATSGGCTFYADGKTSTFGPLTASTSTALTIGGFASQYPFCGNVRAVVAYPTALSPANATAAVAALTTAYNVPTDPTRFLGIDGDSIGLGILSGAYNLNIDRQFTSLPPTRKANVCIPGGQFGPGPGVDLTATAAARLDVYLTPGANNVLVVRGGNNNLANGATGAATYALLQAYVAARRAAGWNKIVVVTELVGRAGALQGGTTSGSFTTNAQAYNTAILTGYAAGTLGAAFVADTTGDPALGSASFVGSAYDSGDHIHPNAAGNRLIATYVELQVAGAFGTGSSSGVATAASTYTVSVPAAFGVAQTATAYVHPVGVPAAPIVVTPTPVRGLTFVPASVTLQTDGLPQSFAVTASAPAAYSLATTNATTGVRDPAPATLTVTTGAATAITGWTATGPATLAAGVAGTYTVSPVGGPPTSPLTVNLTPFAGATFGAASVTLGTNGLPVTFTVTSSTVGPLLVASTSGTALAAPTPLAVTVQPAATVVIGGVAATANTSGTSPLGTSGDAAVTVLPAVSNVFGTLTITNTGTVAGFYSADGGATWAFLPATTNGNPGTVKLTGLSLTGVAVKVKRVAGGTDLAGIYANAD